MDRSGFLARNGAKFSNLQSRAKLLPCRRFSGRADPLASLLFGSGCSMLETRKMQMVEFLRNPISAPEALLAGSLLPCTNMPMARCMAPSNMFSAFSSRTGEYMKRCFYSSFG